MASLTQVFKAFRLKPKYCCKSVGGFHSSSILNDHYKTLGVTRQASQEEIKTAYFNLAKRHHPDNPMGSAKTFQTIAQAYEIVGNPLSRKEYDSVGPIGGYGQRSYSPGANYSQNANQQWYHEWIRQQRQGFGHHRGFTAESEEERRRTAEAAFNELRRRMAEEQAQYIRYHRAQNRKRKTTPPYMGVGANIPLANLRTLIIFTLLLMMVLESSAPF